MIFQNKTGMIKPNDYPFDKELHEIQTTKSRKLALILEQIKQIANFDEGMKATAQYRDLWLFQSMQSN